MGWVVVDGFGCHRSNQANVINDRPNLRKQRTDFDLILTKLGKRMLRPKTVQLLTLKLGQLLSFRKALGHRLTMHLGKLGLWIKRFQLRRPTCHRQPNDAFGPLRQRQVCKNSANCVGLNTRRIQHRCKSDRSNSLRSLAKKRSATLI